MPLANICVMPIQTIAADNSVLFMWATFPKLQEAFQVIDAWGFTYKTVAFVWIKANRSFDLTQSAIFPEMLFDDFMGMGMWTRSNAEIVLLATKGSPKREKANVRQIVYAPITKHSEKPKEVATRIVKLCGALPRIELFARKPNKGWDVYGNEVKSDIVL